MLTSPDLLFRGGIAVCAVAVVGIVAVVIVSRFLIIRLNNKLDAEYGKRRH